MEDGRKEVLGFWYGWRACYVGGDVGGRSEVILDSWEKMIPVPQFLFVGEFCVSGEYGDGRG